MLDNAAADELISSIEANCSSVAAATFCVPYEVTSAILITSVMESTTCLVPSAICCAVTETS